MEEYLPVLDRLTCNFEKDLCKWTQSKSDQFDWTRMKGKTSSAGTGPSESSTGANGMSVSPLRPVDSYIGQ